MKKADWILIVAVLAIGLLAFGLLRWNRQSGSEVVVTVDGQETACFSLQEDRTEILAGPDGGSNTLVIEHGIASVVEADCPDKLCVHQSSIQYDGQTIVCLPHRIVVSVEGGETAEVDGVVK